jgi:hypothetical protein
VAGQPGDRITVSPNPRRGIALEAGATTLCVTPDTVASNASPAVLTNDGGAAVYANVASGTDTVLHATNGGVETFTTLRSGDAPTEQRWHLDLPGDAQLRRNADGSIDVVDPTPVQPDTTATDPPIPTTEAELAQLKAAGLIDPGTQLDPHFSLSDAQQQITEHSRLQSTGGNDPSDLPALAPPDDWQPGDAPLPAPDDAVLQHPPDPASAASDYSAYGDQVRSELLSDLQDRVDRAQAETASDSAPPPQASRPVVLGHIAAPTAVDASGAPVAASLAIDGNTIIVAEQPTATNVYPIVVDPFVTVTKTVQITHHDPVYATYTHIVGWHTQFDEIGIFFGFPPNSGYRDNGDGEYVIDTIDYGTVFWRDTPWYGDTAGVIYNRHDVPEYQTDTVLVGWNDWIETATSLDTVWWSDIQCRTALMSEAWSGTTAPPGCWDGTLDPSATAKAGLLAALGLAARACLEAMKNGGHCRPWENPPRDCELHHIVPQNARRWWEQVETRKILASPAINIAINDPDNLVWLSYRFHRHVHRKDYFKYVYSYVKTGEPYGQRGVRAALRLIGQELQAQDLWISAQWNPLATPVTLLGIDPCRGRPKFPPQNETDPNG